MDILALKPGHDGHIAYVRRGQLAFSVEGEKDSGERYAKVTPSLVVRAAGYVDRLPDVVAISGWVKGSQAAAAVPVPGGYFGSGLETIEASDQTFFGASVKSFSSSHERSHLLCSYGLSPFPQGQPCYALVWEGNIGAFYRIDENVQVKKLGNVLADPGNKYAFLYAVADPTFPDEPSRFRFEDAGKLMALASYGESGSPDKEEAKIIDYILSLGSGVLSSPKRHLRTSRFYNVGVESPSFKRVARRLSDEIFRRFHDFARRNVDERLPLLISGGCGLNCDWNTAWVESGLFSDVFVPPCTNDSGSAIGTAIDAQRHFTGNAKISWDAYAGEEFVYDAADLTGLFRRQLDYDEVAARLANNQVIAWVQGRYEIGPQALGNRSLLAAPFTDAMRQRLNRIKGRENFRPIAPICCEEDIDQHFESHGPSPHMLYFQRLKTDRLAAVTHVDGSARMQSVNPGQNPQMHRLLSAFRQRTGYGVLCNTSLNFKGAGFINRLSDLVRYCRDTRIDGFVVGDQCFFFEDTPIKQLELDSAQ